MISFKPKNDFFFDKFSCAAINCHEAAIALNDLVNNFEDISTKVSNIEELEHKGDAISHEIITHLKKSFITPIDREDIYKITNKIDNVVDRIQTAAFRFEMLNVKIITSETKVLCDMILKCTENLPPLMSELKKLKNSEKLKQVIVEINSIENDADQIFRSSVKSLFRSDIKDIDKVIFKEIYELLEDVVDKCEDVCDKVEEVVMKHA